MDVEKIKIFLKRQIIKHKAVGEELERYGNGIEMDLKETGKYFVESSNEMLELLNSN